MQSLIVLDVLADLLIIEDLKGAFATRGARENHLLRLLFKHIGKLFLGDIS